MCDQANQYNSKRLILCTGMYRSASTWSYNVTRDLFNPELIWQGMLPVYDVATEDTLNQMYKKHSIIVAKIHYIEKSTFSYLLDHADSVYVVFTFRNPLDITASNILRGYSFEQALDLINTDHLESELDLYRQLNTLLLDYDLIFHSEKIAFERIISHLDLNVSEIQKAKIVEKYTRNNVKELTKANQADTFDTETLFWSDHIISEKNTYYKDVLASEQVDIVNQKVSRFSKILQNLICGSASAAQSG